MHLKQLLILIVENEECFKYDTATGDRDRIETLKEIMSPEECQKKCQEYSGCNYFVWTGQGAKDGSKPFMCTLKENFEKTREYPGRILGPKFCPSTTESKQDILKGNL